MIKTRQYYGEQVLNNIAGASLRNRDERVDIREVYLVIDQIVNRLAKEGFLENWKMGFGGVDELWLTRFEWLEPTDADDDGPSYVTLPATYSPLPKLQGINEVYFENSFDSVKKKYFDTIMVISRREFVDYRNNPAGNLEGLVACYPQGNTLVFNKPNINAVYGRVGMALVIKSSFDIADSAPFPIPASIESQLIQEATDIFLKRRFTPGDAVRENNFQA